MDDSVKPEDPLQISVMDSKLKHLEFLQGVINRIRFTADGKLLKQWSGVPRYTRAGAVLVVREVVSPMLEDVGDLDEQVHLEWFVMHNPNCPVTIPTDLPGACPQLVLDGVAMRWTDGPSDHGLLSVRTQFKPAPLYPWPG